MYIEVKNITKSYGTQKVLSAVTAAFVKGQIHGIVGRNGSGKTMLFKCVCGYVKPDEGTVRIDGQTIGKEIAFPRRLGLLLETPGFLPHFSGQTNLEMLYTIRHKKNTAKIAEVLRLVGLKDVQKKHVSKYSLGMRQRLGIAQAIMEDPDMLILDEPFNGLDNQGVKDIRSLLTDMKAQGVTILLASHNPLDIEALCDTVCEMDAGKLTVTDRGIGDNPPS